MSPDLLFLKDTLYSVLVDLFCCGNNCDVPSCWFCCCLFACFSVTQYFLPLEVNLIQFNKVDNLRDSREIQHTFWWKGQMVFVSQPSEIVGGFLNPNGT